MTINLPEQDATLACVRSGPFRRSGRSLRASLSHLCGFADRLYDSCTRTLEELILFPSTIVCAILLALLQRYGFGFTFRLANCKEIAMHGTVLQTFFCARVQLHHFMAAQLTWGVLTFLHSRCLSTTILVRLTRKRGRLVCSSRQHGEGLTARNWHAV